MILLIKQSIFIKKRYDVNVIYYIMKQIIKTTKSIYFAMRIFIVSFKKNVRFIAIRAKLKGFRLNTLCNGSLYLEVRRICGLIELRTTKIRAFNGF